MILLLKNAKKAPGQLKGSMWQCVEMFLNETVFLLVICELLVTCLWMVFCSYLKLLDCGFLCDGLRSDFPWQSKACDFTRALQCLVSVPLSPPTITNKLPLAQHRNPTEPLKCRYNHKGPVSSDFHEPLFSVRWRQTEALRQNKENQIDTFKHLEEPTVNKTTKFIKNLEFEGQDKGCS